MSPFSKKVFASCLLAFLCASGTGLAAPPLRICLQQNDPPLSWRDKDQARGFDVDLSRAIAERLGQPLQIQWFRTPDDLDNNPVTQADALLSDGRCTLVAGYMLAPDSVGRPRAAKGRLPPFEGASAEDRHRWVKLNELIPTRPYRFDALVIALSPAQAGRDVRALADLTHLRLGVQLQGLPDLIAMSYHHGVLANTVVHFTSESALFNQLEEGKIDAAFIDLHQFDAWRLKHPATRITISGYTHSLGLNIGFVGLAAEQSLIARVNTILDDLMRSGALKRMAEADGLSYRPPRSPGMVADLDMAALSQD
jgi:ABC-type amino acid transport substrate-binding protein